MPPLIVPLISQPAAPSVPLETASVPPPAAAEAGTTPRFADALSRAGQPKSADAQAKNASANAGNEAETGMAANPPGAAQAVVSRAKGRVSAAFAQIDQTSADAGTTQSGVAAELAALRMGGALRAATATQSGKNLPHDQRKTDAAETQSAGPTLPPGAMAPLQVALIPPPGKTGEGNGKDGPSVSATSSAGLPTANFGPTAEALKAVAATASEAAKTTHPSGSSTEAANLPARMQGADPAGTGTAPSILFAALHDAATARVDSAVAGKALASHGERSAAQTAPNPAALVAQGVSVPSAASLPTAASTGQSATVHAPVGSPDWGQALSQQVLFAAQGQQQFATLHLNPPQLGPLDVHLQLHDGQIQAQFVSPHAVVRQAVEAALPQLRDMFTGAGLSLMQTSVGTQGGQGGRQDRAPRGTPGLAHPVAVGETGAAGAPAARALQWQQGLVNTYV